jgi:LPPG:FO 2-phospho-L-lactate transferase
MIAVLSGGVGAARFLRGAVRLSDDIVAIVNTADDTVLHGLHISPDLDTVTYTVAGAIDPERGWGLANESWNAMSALARYVPVRPTDSRAAPEWFNLGDRDLATHFYRTARLREGAGLGAVTNEIARAWELPCRVMPMTEEEVRTIVTLAADCVAGSAGDEVSFQEYFVKYRHDVPISAVRFAGSETARPTFLSTIAEARKVIIAPSNPLVSIGPIRALNGVDDALRRRRDDVLAISPIVGGKALKGPADRLMTELGGEASVVGIARIYADVCGTLVIDDQDAHLADDVRKLGMDCIVTDTIMSSPEAAERLAATCGVSA